MKPRKQIKAIERLGDFSVVTEAASFQEGLAEAILLSKSITK